VQKIIFLLLTSITVFTFEAVGQSRIEMMIEGKSFKNTDTGLSIKYGYISSLNTYGITITNKNGAKFYFMNCDKNVSSDELSMTLRSCMNPYDGSGVGTIYIFPKKVIVQASDGRMVYELED
jgi:hypothetical protein